jgi:hypothetical protein
MSTAATRADRGRALLARYVRATRHFARQLGDSKDRRFRDAWVDRAAAALSLEDHLVGRGAEVAGRKWLAAVNACGGLTVVRLDPPHGETRPRCHHTQWL